MPNSQNHAPLFAGIDGGGTRTRVLIVAPDGRCVTLALGESTNINSAGAGIAAINLENALIDAANQAKSPANFAAAFFAMAGVNDSTAARHVSDLIGKFKIANISGYEVANDTRGLHAAAFGVDSGIVLIAGTGSKCYGRAADGREWEAGGVEYLVSDEGSAFDLAIRGIKAALRSMDGRGEKSMLENLIFGELHLTEYGQISQRLHQDSLTNPGQPMTKTEIAALARLVTGAVQQGDNVAQKVLEDSMDSVVETVVAVAKKLNFEPEKTRVGITGGVILNEPGASVFKKSLQKALPGASVVVPQIPPVAGAALRALALGGVPVTPDVIKNLKNTLPEGA